MQQICSWPQWKKEHQIWKKVVTEFRYQEQKAEWGNGSVAEDCIKLFVLKLPLRPWTNNHRPSTSEAQCRLGRRLLILRSICSIPIRVWKPHTLYLVRDIWWWIGLSGPSLPHLFWWPEQDSGLCRGGCAWSTGTCQSLAPSLNLRLGANLRPACKAWWTGWGAELCSADGAGTVQLPAPINRDDLIL